MLMLCKNQLTDGWKPSSPAARMAASTCRGTLPSVPVMAASLPPAPLFNGTHFWGESQFLSGSQLALSSEGASENSPAVYCRVRGGNGQVPKGRLRKRVPIQPFPSLCSPVCIVCYVSFLS